MVARLTWRTIVEAQGEHEDMPDRSTMIPRLANESETDTDPYDAEDQALADMGDALLEAARRGFLRHGDVDLSHADDFDD
jgi:hypothetical protein